MTSEPRWGKIDLERYRGYLQVLAQANLDPECQAKVDASDIAQEALFKAHASIGQFRGGSDTELAAWLRKILANTLADAMRKFRAQKRRAGWERSLDAAVEESSDRLGSCLAADHPSPSSDAMRQERSLLLAEAIAALPGDQRTAVELHHLKGLSLGETAAAMQRTEAAVAGLLRRGAIALKKRLSGQGLSDDST